MPTAYGYARVSTLSQASKGCTLEEQTASTKRYYEGVLQGQGFAWGGIFADPGTTGGMALDQRTAGAELNQRLQPGDVVIITRLDRAFRSVGDLVEAVKRWQLHGIALCLIDLGVDTRTPTGKSLLTKLEAFVDFEHVMNSERIKEVNQHKRNAGLAPTGGQPPYGKKYVTRNGQRVVVDDSKWLSLIEWIRVLNQEQGWSAFKIYTYAAKNNILNHRGERFTQTQIIETITYLNKQRPNDTPAASA